MATKIAKQIATIYAAVEQYNKEKDALEPRIKDALEQLALQMTQPLRDLEAQMENVLQEIQRKNAAKQVSCRHAATIELKQGDFIGGTYRARIYIDRLCPDCGLHEQAVLDPDHPDRLMVEPTPTYALKDLPARAVDAEEFHSVKRQVFERIGVNALQCWEYAKSGGSSLGYLSHYGTSSIGDDDYRDDNGDQMEDIDEQCIHGQEEPSSQQEEMRISLKEKIRQAKNSCV